MFFLFALEKGGVTPLLGAGGEAFNKTNFQYFFNFVSLFWEICFIKRLVEDGVVFLTPILFLSTSVRVYIAGAGGGFVSCRFNIGP